MSSAPENIRAEREGSFFSRVARSIRRALSRICRNSSSSSSDSVQIPNRRYSQEDLCNPISLGISRSPGECYGSFIGRKRKNTNEYPQISKRGDALHFFVHPESEPEVSYALSYSSFTDSLSDWHDDCNFAEAMIVSLPMPSRPDFRFKNTSCESIATPVDAQGIPTVLHDTNICTEGSGTQYGLHLHVQSNSERSTDRVAQVEAPIIAIRCLVTNTVRPPDRSRSSRVSSCLSRSHSMSSQSQIASAKPLTQAQSLPALLLKSSYEVFTPEITADEEEETYRFQSSCPGLYQCRLTGLVFHMEGEGELLYRIVPWNRRLLAQHQKKPAGPLFDITCVPQSVCQLHLPHCEIRSTGACRFLSVAHVKDESIEFIRPHMVTETHVIINITGFSGLGNVKDEDSPPDPFRAQVLLFYRPPADPDPTSILNVLLLSSNVLIKDVKRKRKKIVGEETYIETPPHCKLCPQQEYTLSTLPEDDSVRVQPPEAEFYCDEYENYYPSFQVTLETRMKHIELFLRNSKASLSVWERRVCLSSGVKRSSGQSSLERSAHKRLQDIWSHFIERTSKPLLKSLVDKLFEKKVLTDSERESAEEKQNRSDKAGFVIDTVMKKGDKASSEMIKFLYDADPYLCEQLGLI